ncbi:MAG: serine/threonine protein kinase [Ahniella sp.]|nr:serine/threonine protein kinase [Ahniella sp.]
MNTPEATSDPDWPQLASLFDELADLAQPELNQRLAELAADPHTERLLPRLRALLGAHVADCSGWEQGAGAGGLSHDGPIEPSAEADQFIGPWRLLRVLGQGGMGEVWLAERSDAGFTQQVALKRIRTGIGPQLRSRFLRERRILARLKHPHIAAFIDGGEDDSGAPWLALEYVEGDRILDYCLLNELGPEARVRLVRQMLDALDHAHRLLVVHRDLKPGNVMVDRNGQVKLLDFGIAKLLDDSEAGDDLTRTRMPAPLTPKYAAPEQLLGEPAGIPADLYATGILLFELLTGSSPFGAAPGLARDQPESLWRVWSRAHEAETRSGRATSQMRRMLRGDLQRIIDRSIQRQPQDRYPSAAAFGADLSAWLDHRPLLSRTTPWPERVAKWIRRQPLATASLAAAVFAFVAGSAGMFYQSQRTAERAAQAEASRRFLSEVFNAADPELRDGEAPTLEELLRRGAERLRKDQTLDPRSRVLLLQDIGRASIGLDLQEQADRLLKEAEHLATRVDLTPEETRALALDLVALELVSDKPDAAVARLDHLALPDHRVSPSP